VATREARAKFGGILGLGNPGQVWECSRIFIQVKEKSAKTNYLVVAVIIVIKCQYCTINVSTLGS